MARLILSSPLVFAGVLVALVMGCRAQASAPPSPAPSATASPASPASAVATGEVARVRPPFHAEDPAFAPDRALFSPKLPPKPGEWLDRFPETGVSFDEYVRMRINTRTADRKRIVLQPIGPFDERGRELLGKLREFMEVFFDTPTQVAAGVALPQRGTRTRTDGAASWTQARTDVLLNGVLAPNLPWDAVCYLGVTMTDLYPDERWNYVFGQATLEQRVGVYSLARYFPEFWHRPDTPEARRLALLRSYKVLSHETGHMFSMLHCTRYECNMNGSNSLEEMDSEPAHLCPECLKMLQWNLRFDVRTRYGRLRDIYRREGLEQQAAWIDARLGAIGPAPESKLAR